jgi:multiple sugar transport system permease protein
MRRRKQWKLLISYLLLATAFVFFLFPLYWIIITSIKVPGEVTASPVVWFPKRPTIDNFRLLFGYAGPLWGYKEYSGRSFLPNILPYVRNSLFVSGLSSGLAIILGASLGYAVARFGLGRKNLYTWLLSLRMVPPVVAAIPLFLVFRSFRLIDTPWALVIAYLLINIPFATLLLIGFFSDIPKDLSDAALLDGCSEYGAFFRIALPLVAPALVAVFTIAFLMAWNELLIANALTASARAQTFPVYTTMFSQVERGTAWGPAAAGGVIGMIPMLVSSFYIQRYLSRGLTMGAVVE